MKVAIGSGVCRVTCVKYRIHADEGLVASERRAPGAAGR